MRKADIVEGPAMERHIRQRWPVGQRVKLVKRPEPALRNVPKARMTGEGIISKVTMKFPRTARYRRACYWVTMDREFFSEYEWCVVPGDDSIFIRPIGRVRKFT
ncbi:MAG: hypothetical protein V3W44_10000 [Dehalococcoidales bacterium]